MKNEKLIVTGGTLATYQIFRAANVDTYSRNAIAGVIWLILLLLVIKGKVSGFYLAALLVLAGIDLGVSIFTGAKVRKNEYDGDFAVISENKKYAQNANKGDTYNFWGVEGIVTPYYAKKGKVFKAKGGTMLKINKDGSITTIGGFGKSINHKTGGEMDYDFCKTENDKGNPAWLELYKKGQTLFTIH